MLNIQKISFFIIKKRIFLKNLLQYILGLKKKKKVGAFLIIYSSNYKTLVLEGDRISNLFNLFTSLELNLDLK